MPKLHINIEGTDEEIQSIAEHICDCGGEEAMTPIEFSGRREYMLFNYEKCFPAHGYDPIKDGLDRVISVTIENGSA